MNRKKVIAFLAGMLLAFVMPVFAAGVPGVFLQEGGWLWTEQDDGIMVAKVKLSAGTALTVETDGAVDESGAPVAKSKESEYDGSKGKTLTFVQVQYDGKSYWAISNRLVMQKKPAVLVENSAMYNSKSLADVINAHLDIGSVVAVGSASSVTGNVNLVELSYYSERLYAVRTVYVKASKVSSSLDDITAFKILDNATKTSDAAKRAALFESVEKLNLSDKVLAAIHEARRDMESSADMLSEGTELLSGGDAMLTVGTSDLALVNVRNIPGSNAGGTVVDKLASGTPVRAVMRTVKTETIEGITAPWVMLSEPVEGWVFGGYTAPAE